jgi:hypothetical protein
MRSRIIRLAFSCLLGLSGAGEVTRADDPWVDPAFLCGLMAREYWAAIEQSQSALPEFVASFQNRSKAQSRFLVCGLERQENRLVPVGVLVDRIEQDTFFGTRLENDIKAKPSQQRAEMEFKYVVDWSYVDLWELQGGRLWREVYRKLSKGHRLGAADYLLRFCRLDPPPKQTAIERKLLRSIIESDYELFERLFQEAGSPQIIPTTNFDESRPFTVHGSSTIWTLAMEYSSVPFVKRYFASFDTPSTDLLYFAVSIKRSDVLDLVLASGVSANVRSDMLNTPLHIASQSADEYAVARLLEKQVNINAQDNGGRTALHNATNAKIFSMLLDAGADPYIKTDSPVEPQNAIERAISEGYVDILDECERRGLIAPRIREKTRKEPSIYEKGEKAIQEYERSIGSDSYDVSKSFRAGPVLPFDYLDARSGRIGFGDVGK